jgi:hypothetical protein
MSRIHEEIMAVRLTDFLAKLPEEDQDVIRKRTAELIAEAAMLRQIRDASERPRE